MNTTNKRDGLNELTNKLRQMNGKPIITTANKQDETLEPLDLLVNELRQSNVRQYTCVNDSGYSQLERNIVTILTTWQKEQDKIIVDGILKKLEELKEEYDLMLQERDTVRKVSHDRKVIIDKLIEALEKTNNEYNYSLKLLAECGGIAYSENNFSISNKQLLNSLK